MDTTGRPFSDVIALVRQHAEEAPDVAGRTCTYFNDAQPSCIVGFALNDLGVKPVTDYDFGQFSYQMPGYRYKDLLGPDGGFFATANLFAQELPWYKLGFDDPTGTELAWIQTVQSGQDKGMSWSRAVHIADTEIGVL